MKFSIIKWIKWIKIIYKKIKKETTIYVDERGYERYGGYDNRLIHRDIAYNYIYKKGYRNGVYTKRFRDYDIHHKDGNKRNNSINNLQILTREEHEEIHNKQRR